MVTNKKLKYLHLSYDYDTHTFGATTFDPASKDVIGTIDIPRHYMFSMMRFLVRVLQRGKPRK